MKTIKCEKCKKEYRNKKAYFGHLATCRKEKNIKCPYCIKKYILQGYLENHIQSKHKKNISANESAKKNISANKSAKKTNGEILGEHYIKTEYDPNGELIYIDKLRDLGLNIGRLIRIDKLEELTKPSQEICWNIYYGIYNYISKQLKTKVIDIVQIE